MGLSQKEVKTYHKDVYMTEDMVKGSVALYSDKLEKTEHFFNRSRGKFDKYVFDHERFNEIIEEIQKEKPKPFEVDTDLNGNVVKCCIRASYDEYRDICIVFRKNRIITFWFNSVNDNHMTLDKSKYCKC